MGKDSLLYVFGKRGVIEWLIDIFKKLCVVKEKGVVMVFIIDLDFKNNVGIVCCIIFNCCLKMGWSKNFVDNFVNNVFIFIKVVKDIIGSQYKKVVKV